MRSDRPGPASARPAERTRRSCRRSGNRERWRGLPGNRSLKSRAPNHAAGCERSLVKRLNSIWPLAKIFLVDKIFITGGPRPHENLFCRPGQFGAVRARARPCVLRDGRWRRPGVGGPNETISKDKDRRRSALGLGRRFLVGRSEGPQPGRQPGQGYGGRHALRRLRMPFFPVTSLSFLIPTFCAKRLRRSPSRACMSGLNGNRSQSFFSHPKHSVRSFVDHARSGMKSGTNASRDGLRRSWTAVLSRHDATIRMELARDGSPGCVPN